MSRGRVWFAAALCCLGGAAALSGEPAPPKSETPPAKEQAAPAKKDAPAKPKEVPDALDRFKEVRAGDILFRFAAEERIRVERWNNEDLNDHKHDRDRRVFNRLRLRADAIFNKSFRTVVELVDGREWDSERRPRGQNDDLDLHQAYVQVDQGPFMVRLGRQEIDLGSRKLVAAPTWNNILRSFDAGRVTFTSDIVDVTVFSGSAVVGVDDEFNEHRHDENFSGVFTTWKLARCDRSGGPAVTVYA